MKTERFEYRNKDIPLLRKDLIFRLIFMIAFFAIFAWQFTMFVIAYNHNELNLLKTIITIAMLISALVFALVAFSYLFKDLTTMQKVALHGSAVTTVTIISTGAKNSFLKIYYIITTLITMAMFVVLACALTYNILQFVYFSTFSYYLPLIIFIVLAGFNSVYHIKAEIKLIQEVTLFNSF